jgi:ABC-type sugar transport system ATPase subunit
VALVEQLGAETHVICSLPDDTKVVVRQGHGAVRPDIGEAVSIELDPSALHLFSAEDGARLESSG